MKRYSDDLKKGMILTYLEDISNKIALAKATAENIHVIDQDDANILYEVYNQIDDLRTKLLNEFTE